jgi:hypothetical protein
MSSLKEKFEKFSEEPGHTSWEKMLKRLDAEMPAGRGKRFRGWFLPVFLISICGTWGALAVFNDSGAKANTGSVPVVISQGADHGAYTSSSAGSHPADAQSNQNGSSAQQNAGISQTVQGNEQHNSDATASAVHQHPNVQPQTPAIIPSPNNPSEPVVNTPPPAHESNTESGDKNKTLEKLSFNGHILQPSYYPAINAGNEVAVRSRKEYLRFVLEIFYGAGFSSTIFKAPENTSMGNKTISDGLAFRKAITDPGYSFSTGTNLKYFLNTSLQVEAGFHFTQQTQTMYYSVDSVCGCHVGLEQAGASTEQLFSTSHDSLSKAGTSIHSFTNRYSMREIPVIFNYYIPDQRFGAISYKASLGFTYMHYTMVNSRMPDADKVGFVETRGLDAFPKYRNSFSALVGTGVIYHGGYNVDWSISPQFKIAMRGITTNPYWLQEFPWQFQLGFGVGHRF